MNLVCFLQVDAQAQTALTVEPDADPHVYTLPLGVVRGSGERNVSVTLNYSCELQAEGRGTVRLWMPDLALPGSTSSNQASASSDGNVPQHFRRHSMPTHVPWVKLVTLRCNATYADVWCEVPLM